MTYKIVRRSLHGYRRTIKRGLTLQEAQAHCSDPQTSSQTCTRSDRKRLTKRLGPWFDDLVAALNALHQEVLLTDAAFSPANVTARVVLNRANEVCHE